MGSMNALSFLVSALATAAVGYVVRDLSHVAIVRDRAFSRAQELAGGKGVINIGAGPGRTYLADVISNSPAVRSNVDIVPNGVPRYLQLDIEGEALPFPDKRFGSAFASHVLEHLDNWPAALSEMVRVSDHTVVVLPDPVYFSGWLMPGHRQHFSREEMREIAELYGVEVWY